MERNVKRPSKPLPTIWLEPKAKPVTSPNQRKEKVSSQKQQHKQIQIPSIYDLF